MSKEKKRPGRKRQGKGLLSPRNDYVFKRLLGDPAHIDLLKDFLLSILDLPKSEYKSLILMNPHLPGEYPGDKEGILDVKIITRSKKVINVEIQVEPFSSLPERILFYTANMVTEQIRESEDYDIIKQVTSIVITDHIVHKGHVDYHQRFRLRNDSGKLLFTDKLEIHTLELPKVPPVSDDTELWKWPRFFAAKTKGDFEMVSKASPVIAKAYAVLQELSADEQARQIAESREKHRRDEAARRKDAQKLGEEIGKKKGRVEGRVEGRAEGRAEMVQNMLLGGMSHAQVAALTKLPLAEVKRLAKEPIFAG